MNNKTFKNNKTGEIVKVIDSFENIAILENKTKEQVSNLLNPSLYTEQIDPNNFLNIQNTYSSIAEQIKSIPIDSINDAEESVIQVNADKSFSPIINEPAIIQVSEDYEREELIKKYGAQNDRSELDRQNESFSRLLDEENVQKIEVVREGTPVQNDFNKKTQTAEDPIITMFRNVKRNKEFSINLEIKNKIPRPDFIELMEDSYNYSIIDFLAQEFTDKILRNPQLIEDMIKQKIKEIVYGIDFKDEKDDIEIKTIENKEIETTVKRRGRPKKENS